MRSQSCGSAGWIDVPVDFDLAMHEPEDVVAVVRAARLVDLERYRRRPPRAPRRDDHPATWWSGGRVDGFLGCAARRVDPRTGAGLHPRGVPALSGQHGWPGRGRVPGGAAHLLAPGLRLLR